ncbi:HD domain-containing protein [Chondromyces apiculatus]|uniref:DNTP triphosphohydrolase, putative n=1 Tax=Chondromyces apiculatus DSM 436 TaxID=1192034 RepID=A0A017T246_9BACT|nr:HD domain-containing protein [Chondromyces apiculatus]EYF03318.1 dNTP triphosphohydrolase, putative [Chondromyces apiculatus DSM 436]
MPSNAGRLLRPYIFRDPVHGDIAFPRNSHGALVRKLIDDELFQRLRSIQQNGVLNLVFPGAEHSRFAHSIGAAHLAGRMYDAACRNSDRDAVQEERELVTIAALLHDVGHGPFSHLLEEILGKNKFHHETLTSRILVEEGSSIASSLRAHDQGLPEKLLPFIEYQKRKPDRWFYALVSSQLDADRLDYTARDAMMCGVLSHRFDRDRLIGALFIGARTPDTAAETGTTREFIVVDDRARDVVENYLHALYHLYQSIYFHHTARAVSWLLNAALRRARELAMASETDRLHLFAPASKPDPLWALMEHGNEVSLSDYMRLDEAHVWSLVQRWRDSNDPTLRDLCDRLKHRRFFKAIDVLTSDFDKLVTLQEEAKDRVRKTFPDLNADYYVRLDQTDRENDKPYRWGQDDSGSDPILLVSKQGSIRPIEDEKRGKSMLDLFDSGFRTQRLIVPEEVREGLPPKLLKGEVEVRRAEFMSTFQDQLDLASMLALMVTKARRLDGRLRVQKLMYLLQQRGAKPLQPFLFQYHHYGPFSAEVADAIKGAVKSKLIDEREESDESGWKRYEYTPAQQAATYAARVDGPTTTLVEQVLTLCEKAHWRTLELAATIDFLQRTDHLEREQAVREALERKPQCANYESQARALLSDLHL